MPKRKLKPKSAATPAAPLRRSPRLSTPPREPQELPKLHIESEESSADTPSDKLDNTTEPDQLRPPPQILQIPQVPQAVRTMEEEDDDMYALEATPETKPKTEAQAQESIPQDQTMQDGEDDEDEEEDEDDSDIEIVTEAKPGTKPEPPSQGQRGPGRPSESIPIKSDSPAPTSKPAAATTTVKLEGTKKVSEPQRPGSSYPPIRTSSIDIDAKPVHEPSGKLITEVDMDADFGEDDKPWRRPGSDQTDYFNYGFDEFTWASYCLKQDQLRKEAKDQKKQVEDMQNFMGLGGGAGAGGSGGPGPGAMPGMGGMGGPNDFPPEMQQMMQQMMASGMDPSQMDFGQFMQMMGPGAQGMGGGFGQNQQQMGGGGFGGGGYGGGGGGGGGGHGGHGNHGGHGGRGRGRGRW